MRKNNAQQRPGLCDMGGECESGLFFLMVPHDWIRLASTQPVQSCPLPPLCLLWQFVAGLRVASVRSSEGSPATIFNFHRPPGSLLPPST